MTIFHESDFVQPQGRITTKVCKGPDNLYRLDFQSQEHQHHIKAHTPQTSSSFAIRHDKPLPLSTWHATLSHTSIDDVMHVTRNEDYGIKLLQSNEDINKLCESCVMGKMARATFKRSDNTPEDPGSLIVSDLMGSMDRDIL
jgi:hypothetical protein